MMEPPIDPDHDHDHQPPPTPSLWQENHGNLLMIFLAIIFLVGAGILTYRQNRFRPPRFPSGNAIQIPEPAKGVSAAETVTVAVSGAESDSGTIMIAVYGTAENFNIPDKAAALQSLEIQDGAASWSISADALPDNVAIAAYHDANGDGTLNRNRLGIPTERYGYSRAARSLTGPPRFDDAVIDRPRNGEQVAINLR